MKTTYRTYTDEEGCHVHEHVTETGHLHRDDCLLAQQIFWPNNKLKSEAFYQYGEWHREGDLPANTEWYEDGTKKREDYCVHGMWHRIGKPSLLMWHPTGELYVEEYHLWGNNHRENGASETIYNKNGTVSQEVYRLLGDLYRREGAAHTTKYHKIYTINDIRVDLNAELGRDYHITGWKPRESLKELQAIYDTCEDPVFVETLKREVEPFIPKAAWNIVDRESINRHIAGEMIDTEIYAYDRNDYTDLLVDGQKGIKDWDEDEVLNWIEEYEMQEVLVDKGFIVKKQE